MVVVGYLVAAKGGSSCSRDGDGQACEALQGVVRSPVVGVTWLRLSLL